MNLYILRHGQTNYNVEGRFQGQVDTLLNETGEKQVEETATELSHIDFDIVISSPLTRAIQTAKKVTKKEIHKDIRIIERSFGILEGQLSVPDYEENFEKYKIEPMESLQKRVNEFLDEVKEKYSKKQNVLVVTHEAIAQVIEAYFNGIPKSNNIKPGQVINPGKIFILKIIK